MWPVPSKTSNHTDYHMIHTQYILVEKIILYLSIFEHTFYLHDIKRGEWEFYTLRHLVVSFGNIHGQTVQFSPAAILMR